MFVLFFCLRFVLPHSSTLHSGRRLSPVYSALLEAAILSPVGDVADIRWRRSWAGNHEGAQLFVPRAELVPPPSPV